MSTGGKSITFESTLNGPSVVTVNTTSASPGTITFDGAVGNTTNLLRLTTEGGGTTAVNGGSVTTNGLQDYQDVVTLGASTSGFTSNGGGSITFGSTLDGASAVTINTTSAAPGTITFSGAVGGTTALSSLTTEGGGTTQINGGGVTTGGLQDYQDAVTLGGGVTGFTSTTGSPITFASTLEGSSNVTVNTTSPATITFGGAVGSTTPLASLTTEGGGTTQINGGGVTTSGLQDYQDAVTLGAPTTGFTSIGGGPITFESTLDGDSAVTVNTTSATPGTITFGGLVGSSTALASLTTEGGGTTQINGGGVTTTLAQTYDDPVTQGADAHLTGSTLILGPSWDADSHSLWLTFTSPVTVPSVFTNIDNFTSDGAGGTTINTTITGSFTTSGSQMYGNAAALTADATLVSTGGGNISFSMLDGAHVLQVNTAGATIFGGLVGSVTPLTSLTTDAAGTTQINGGGVTSSGPQTYKDPVTLGANTTLTSNGGGDITFGGALDGAQALQVSTAGATIFGGLVGSTTPLASLTVDAAGTTQINGGGVTTSGDQTYNDPVTLYNDPVPPGADTTTTLTGAVFTFQSTLDSGPVAQGNLTINAQAGLTTVDAVVHAVQTEYNGGNVSFQGTVGGLGEIGDLILNSTGGGGANGIDVNSDVHVDKNQVYGIPVYLSQDVTLSSGGSVSFLSTVDSEAGSHFGLTVNASAGTQFSGNVGSTSALGYLTVEGGSQTDLGGAAATIAVTTQALAGSNPATAAGPTNHNGNQDFKDPVVLEADTTITAAAAGGVNPNVTFEQTVDSLAGSYYGLVVNDPGTTWFEGNVGVSGATTALGYLTTDAAGTTQLGSGSTISVETQGLAGSNPAAAAGPTNHNGNQDFKDPLVLEADTAITAAAGGGVNPNVTFEQTVDSLAGSYYGLVVNDPGTTWFEGNVGATAGNTALGYLTTDAAGTTQLGSASTISVETQAVNATRNGDQDFKDSLVLEADTTITATAGGGVNPNVTFEQMVDSLAGSYYGMIVNDPGTTWFEGNVGVSGATTALGYLTTDAAGTTQLGSGGTISVETQAVNATRNGDQDFKDSLVLEADTTITATAGGGVNPNVTFEQTVDSLAGSYYGLVVNDPGTTWFEGNVGVSGVTTALGYLTTDAAGTTQLGSGSTISVDTQAVNATRNGDQDFKDPLVLEADTTITAAAGGGVNPNVTFEQTVDSLAGSYYGLVVNDPGTTWFEGNVGVSGATTALGYLTTDAAGTTQLGSGSTISVDTQAVNATRNGNQDFKDPVWLWADTAITAAAGGGVNPNVTFEQTVDSLAGSYYGLVVNDPGTTWFEGNVGVSGATTALGYLTTGGGGTTTIDGGTVTSSGTQVYQEAVTLSAGTTLTASTVTFDATVAGASNWLAIVGNAVLDGTVTGLSSLNVSGTTAIDGGTVTSSGTQVYQEAVTLSAGTTLTASTATFDATVAGGSNWLAIVGNAVLDGAVTGLSSLNVSGTTAIDGGTVTSSGTQVYQEAVTLSAGTTLTASTATFDATVAGASNSLAIVGNAVLDGAVTGLSSLNVGGTTAIDGGTVTSSGTQVYQEAVTLSDGTTLTASTVTFDATVAGASNSLAIVGNAVLDGAVTGLSSLNVGGTTAIDGGTVTSSGTQVYQEAVTLSAGTTLTASTVTFDATVAGASNSLAIVGNAVLDGAVTGLSSLNVSGATAIDGGTVTSSGTQVYQEVVTLSAGTTLTASTVTFDATVAGGSKSLAIVGNAVLDGAVTGLSSLNVSGATAIDGATVTSSGTQVYQEGVTLSAGTTLTASTVTFDATVVGASNWLAIVGNAVLDGAVTGLSSLNVGGATAIDGGTVTSSGTQVYQEAVTLSAGTTLTASTVTFDATVAGGSNWLAIVGSAVLDGAVTGLSTLNVSGATAIDGGTVTSSGTQVYQEAVTLSAGTTLTASTVTFDATVAGGSNSLAIVGDAVLDGAVTGLSSLNVSGATAIDGGTVTSSATQVYQEAVTLSAGTTLTASTVTFDATVAGGSNSLAILGNAVLDGAVTGLSSLNVSGTTAIDGGTVISSGTQVYQEAVTLSAGTTLTASTVTFDATVAGVSNWLAIVGNTVLDGAATGLSSLDIKGAADLNGGTVTTQGGGQTYEGAVTLSTTESLTDTGGGKIWFKSTVDAATAGVEGLTTSTTGITEFDAAVGGVMPLASLTVTTDGPMTLAQNITTSGKIIITVTNSPVASNDTMTVNPGVTVLSTTGSIKLTADNTLISGNIEAPKGGVLILVGATGKTSTTSIQGTATSSCQIISSTEPVIQAQGGSNTLSLNLSLAKVSTYSLEFDGTTYPDPNGRNQMNITGYSTTMPAKDGKTMENFYDVNQLSNTSDTIKVNVGIPHAFTINALVNILQFNTQSANEDWFDVTLAQLPKTAPAGTILINGGAGGVKLQAHGGGDNNDFVKVGYLNSTPSDPIQVSKNLGQIQMFAGPGGSLLENDTAINSLLVGPSSPPSGQTEMFGGTGNNVFVDDHKDGGKATMASAKGSGLNVFYSGYTYNQSTGAITALARSSMNPNTIDAQYGARNFVFADNIDTIIGDPTTETNGLGYLGPLEWLEVKRFTNADFSAYQKTLTALGFLEAFDQHRPR